MSLEGTARCPGCGKTSCTNQRLECIATDEFELVPQPYDTGVWCTSCDRYETTEPRTVTCEGCGCEAEAHQPAMVVPR